MSLHTELQALMVDLGQKVPKEMMEKVGTFIARLSSDGVGKSTLKPGDTAPDFALQSASGRTVALSSLVSHGPVVVTFFRGDWCPFCDLELRAFNRSLPDFTARGASLVAISPQSLQRSRSTAQDRALAFEVLSDVGSSVAKAYGVSFSLNESEQDLHRAFGADIAAINAVATWEIPVPATFVIDRSGRIAWTHVDPNYTNRAEPADVLRALDTLSPTSRATN